MSKIAVITKNFPRHFDFIVSLMETGHLACAAMIIDEDIKDGIQKWMEQNK